MYTLDEAIKKFYNPKKDYEKEIKKNYKGATGLSEEDGDNVLYAIKQVRAGKIEGAIRHLNTCDTEVREVFVRMLMGE